MRLARAAALAGLASACFRAGATSELEAGLSREHVSAGLPQWKSTYLEAVHELRPRSRLFGVVQESERFGLRDSQIGAGGYLALKNAWSAQAEALYSAEHHVLPQSSIFGELSRTLAGGWGLSAGLRRNEYTATGARIISLGAERYWDQWRAAYTLYSGRPDGAGSATAHRVQLDRYYGERSTIGVRYVTGREVENAGPVGGLITSQITGAELVGRHWITPGWALTASATTHRQGNLYERRGFRLGLRHRF